MNNETKYSELIESYERFIPKQLINLLGKKSIFEVNLSDQIEKEMTIFFSDIRNFTDLSEKMTPQENFNFLNSYLKQMEPVISKHNGIIDKFIGDAIMAIFPETPEDAINCALDMFKQLKIYNEGRKRAGYEPIEIGFGINTGYMMLGIVGGHGRMEPTVISDSVNLASRLEKLTRTYGSKILISSHTYVKLKSQNKFSARFADRILIKGKQIPVSIYEIYDAENPGTVNLKNHNKELIEEAIALYYMENISESFDLLKKCLDYNSDDKLADFYFKRCKKYFDEGIYETSSDIKQKIEWNEEFKIDHKRIDEQHRQLIDMSYRLFESINENNSKVELEEIINFLEQYVNEHFRDEEDYMFKTSYPFIETQKQQHRKFIDEFLNLKNEILNSNEKKVFLVFRTHILIIDWIFNHILKMDMHFGRYLDTEIKKIDLKERLKK